jgi:SSS family solute:Na+ symporter
LTRTAFGKEGAGGPIFGSRGGLIILAAESQLRLDANWVDYLLIAAYFVFVLGIGLMAKRSVSSSIDFFLSGRSLPAWVTGLAFILANLGAV